MYKDKFTRYIVTFFFVLLLTVTFGLNRLDNWSFDVSNSNNREVAKDRYGFYLDDYTVDAGLEFTHHAPQLDSKLDHIMPQVASVGASVSIVDYNNDGWQDIYLTNSSFGKDNALYRNNRDGTFTDVAAQLGVGNLNRRGTGVSMGSVWGDFNNDGYEDLFIYKWGKPILLRNERGEGFTDITAKANLPGWLNSNTAVWLDFDSDGKLDLFVGGYFDEKVDLWNLETTRIMPESFEYARNGGRNYLFHNKGGGVFMEIADSAGVNSRRWSLAAASADINGSGYPDLIVANDYGVDELFINREGKYFEQTGTASGLGFSPKSGMNVSFGDILNSGNPSIYITNISEPGILIQGNNLWASEISGNDNSLRFQNLAGNLGIELGGWSYGAQFGDLNNDGYLDLYVANGYVSAEEGTDYWYDFSKVAGGHENIISDARNWPSMDGRSLSGYQENKIWLNDGAGKFQEIAGAVGGSLVLDSRAVATADFWNRGVLDIVVASQRGPVKLYRNDVNKEMNWIGFKLIGTESNRSAIGAMVKVKWNGRTQMQFVTGGSGFSSQNQRPLHFGLGKNPSLEEVTVRWPSGTIQKLNDLSVNQLHVITENK